MKIALDVLSIASVITAYSGLLFGDRFLRRRSVKGK